MREITTKEEFIKLVSSGIGAVCFMGGFRGKPEFKELIVTLKDKNFLVSQEEFQSYPIQRCLDLDLEDFLSRAAIVDVDIIIIGGR